LGVAQRKRCTRHTSVHRLCGSLCTGDGDVRASVHILVRA
jgi:hypothetical protein